MTLQLFWDCSFGSRIRRAAGPGAQTDAITAVKAAFEREGITIPFPQRMHSPRSGSCFNVQAPGGTGQEAVDRQPGTETEAEED